MLSHMNSTNCGFVLQQPVTKDEMYHAYRKAKIDLYYSSYRRVNDLSDWETCLDANLNELLQKINDLNEIEYFQSDEFVGQVTYLPKKLGATAELSKSTNVGDQDYTGGRENSVFIDLRDEQSNQEPQQRELSFRLLERCSIGLHVLSALWVAKVGEKLEKQRPKSLYSNFVRRTRQGAYNAAALGTYVPYIHGYRKWRDGAVKAAETLIKENEETAVVFNADISNFYYQLDPKLLDDKTFEELIVNEAERRVHECLKIALKAWSYGNFRRLEEEVGLRTDSDDDHIGLPGGISASPILADWVLYELDHEIDAQLNPSFYGRYVDDIVIVFRQSRGMEDLESIRKWITKRLESFSYVGEEGNGGYFEYLPPRLKAFRQGVTTGSCLRFRDRKTRIFLLGGCSGEMSIELLKQQMAQASSEWRLMPVLPSNPKALIGDISVLSGDVKNPVPQLGLLDEISIDRNQLSRVFRDFEFYSRNVDNRSWIEHRLELYNVAKNRLFRSDSIPNYVVYIPRIIRLGLNCGDFQEVVKMIRSIVEQIERLRDCQIEVAGFSLDKSFDKTSRVFDGWKRALYCEIESLIHGISPLNIELTQRQQLLGEAAALKRRDDVGARATVHENGGEGDSGSVEQKFGILLSQDLALDPFREYLAPGRTSRVNTAGVAKLLQNLLENDHGDFLEYLAEANYFEGNNQNLSPRFRKDFTESIGDFIKALSVEGKNDICALYPRVSGLFRALVFPTRALYASQIMTWTSQFNAKKKTDEDCEVEFSRLEKWVGALRGYWLTGFLESGRGRFKVSNGSVSICNPKIDVSKGPINIAVTSVQTDGADWERAAWGRHRLDKRRLEQFTYLVNSVLRVHDNIPKYVLMPELSIPPMWFEEIAYGLAKRGINLIGGVEYQKRDSNQVVNQIWASLIDYSFGFPIFSVYRQDKQRPSVGERRKLASLNGLSLEPETPFPVIGDSEAPPIIRHGNFRFALLVCSELSNIRYKAALRGKVDCLFVAEWNRDIHTFNDLVNAAGWDIHTYVVQSNNRQYGDSRIRAPYKAEYKRDIVRIRGGLHDHFVVGSIDVASLRAFQSKVSSLSGVFKPIPDGFIEEMDGRRVIIPES